MIHHSYGLITTTDNTYHQMMIKSFLQVFMCLRKMWKNWLIKKRNDKVIFISFFELNIWLQSLKLNQITLSFLCFVLFMCFKIIKQTKNYQHPSRCVCMMNPINYIRIFFVRSLIKRPKKLISSLSLSPPSLHPPPITSPLTISHIHNTYLSQYKLFLLDSF